MRVIVLGIVILAINEQVLRIQTSILCFGFQNYFQTGNGIIKYQMMKKRLLKEMKIMKKPKSMYQDISMIIKDTSTNELFLQKSKGILVIPFNVSEDHAN